MKYRGYKDENTMAPFVPHSKSSRRKTKNNYNTRQIDK